MPRKPAAPEPRPWSPLLTVEEVAERLKLPKQTIYYWRTQGIGPRGKVVGRHVRFREDDLALWLDQQPDLAA